MKNVLILLAFTAIFFSAGVMATKNNDHVLTVGSESSVEKINISLLDQSNEYLPEIKNSKVLNFKADSIRDTQRKSFHSLRNVEELTNDDVMIIK